MRFHIGAIPHTPDFNPEAPTWSSIREPKPWTLTAIAVPIGIASAVLIALLWVTLTPLEEVRVKLTVVDGLLYLGGLIVVHELIHALMHPGAGWTSHSVLGVWPSHMSFYAAYTGELSRNRFLAVLLMPLIVITILPLPISALTQAPSPSLAGLSTVNAFLSCGDVVGAALVWYQIPRTAIVRNQGWQTYWRPAGGGV